MAQFLQVLGAIGALLAYGLSQARVVKSDSYSYLLLNLASSLLLSTLAGLAHEFGFLLLEGSWAIISTAGLVAKIRSVQKSSFK